MEQRSLLLALRGARDPEIAAAAGVSQFNGEEAVAIDLHPRYPECFQNLFTTASVLPKTEWSGEVDIRC